MAPRELRKRKGYVRGEGEGEVIEANPDATGVELHKDSRFYASWQSFKDNNPVVNKFVDIRVKVQFISFLTNDTGRGNFPQFFCCDEAIRSRSCLIMAFQASSFYRVIGS